MKLILIALIYQLSLANDRNYFFRIFVQIIIFQYLILTNELISNRFSGV